ncbi:MAG: methyltransferase domain-containing protein [Nocardioidaceae bacterium]
MTTIDQEQRETESTYVAPAVDEEALLALAEHVGQHATAAVNAALVSLGDQLGLWRALARSGPVTAGELSRRTGLSERLLQEWLSSQAANGFLEYEAARDEFRLTPEGALVLADEDTAVSMVAVFAGLPSIMELMPALAGAFRTGEGIGWHEHDDSFFAAQEKFSRPLQREFLLDVWLGAVPGLSETLSRGAKVADVGCGYGTSTILLGERYPQAQITGFDFHDQSVAHARATARERGVADHVTFEVADARALPGSGYDVILLIDALHDMGDPVAAAQHLRSLLVPDGVLVSLDPAAADTLADNLAHHPMAGLMYAVSTFLCTPTAIAQHGPYALGALAGESAIRQVLTDAGFTDVQRVGPDLPFNMVVVARP